ncbi:unnamed protein product [Sphenostylis stenocarpa]|uniref:Uncharacterized protein n=1 Tax=Sphenostylis stenocarpa TaxID=92480 RepID=A0AA86SW83_9FABA|nr:unnamed protein product [Sphenostylis stenocarpa]
MRERAGENSRGLRRVFFLCQFVRWEKETQVVKQGRLCCEGKKSVGRALSTCFNKAPLNPNSYITVLLSDVLKPDWRHHHCSDISSAQPVIECEESNVALHVGKEKQSCE